MLRVWINLWGDRSFIIQVLGPSKLAGLSKSDRKTPGKYHGSYNGKLKGNPFWLSFNKKTGHLRETEGSEKQKTSPKNWLPGTVHNPTKAKDCQQQQKLDSYRKGCSEKVLISKVFAGAAPQPKSPPCSLLWEWAGRFGISFRVFPCTSWKNSKCEIVCTLDPGNIHTASGTQIPRPDLCKSAKETVETIQAMSPTKGKYG